MQWGKIDDELIRLSIMGKVDEILQYKTSIDLQRIFLERTTKRQAVLIEGAPGTGKSTLALHICQEWAEDKLFQEYTVVVLVRLRDSLIHKATSTEDFLSM